MVTCGPSGSCVRCAAHREPIREVAANPPVVAIAAKGCTLDASPPLLHRPHAVVLRVVSELGKAERLQKRRHIHAEAAPESLLQAVPALDRVLWLPPPSLDRAVRPGPRC